MLQIAVFILLPYALLATIGIGMLIFNQKRVPSSLEALPDVIGKFPMSKRPAKGTSALKLPSVTATLPEHLRGGLGQPITLNQLQVVADSIEIRPVTAVQKNLNGETKTQPLPQALVLSLKLKNLSSDVVFSPTDPAFVRKPANNSDPVYTGVQFGKTFIPAGQFSFPQKPPVDVMYFEGQEDDGDVLQPGEERTYMIVATAPRAVREVTTVTEPLTWRVQLRCGLLEWNGDEYPVTGVVGVTFTAKDITRGSKAG
jgi:hypothetical protein